MSIWERRILNRFYSKILAHIFKKNREEGCSIPSIRPRLFLCVLFSKGNWSHEIDFTNYPVELACNLFLNLVKHTLGNSIVTRRGSYILFHIPEFFWVGFNAKLKQLPIFFSYENPTNLRLKNNWSWIRDSRLKK